MLGLGEGAVSARTVVGRSGCGSVAVLVALAWCAPVALSAAAPATSATITPSLAPDRLGARASLTVALAFAGGAAGVPSPVRQAVMQLPIGMTLDVPHLVSCTAAGLQARGARGCPARSRLGGGHATVEALTGAQLVTETVALDAFLGPPANLRPTFEILAEGHTPVESRVVFGGSMRGDRAPYGEQLVLSIPTVATLPQAPDASVRDLSLTVGGGGRRSTRPSVLVPTRCPAGGFPFAAALLYADGSSGAATAKIPCPPRARVAHTVRSPARASRTVSLQETGHLHLTSKHNFTLNEVGTASGTDPGAIYVHLTAVSSTRVTAEVNIYARGGSITGYGAGSYRRSGTSASFSGSLSIARGTGRYAHIHGSGLSFSGTIQESARDAIAVRVSGRVSV
jgi:hypothetical protein